MTEAEKEALIDRLRRKYEFYARVSGDGTEHETMILLREAAAMLRRAPQPTEGDDEGEWEYGWFCEWAGGSGVSRLLGGSENWGPNGRVFQMRRLITAPGPWEPVTPKEEQ